MRKLLLTLPFVLSSFVSAPVYADHGPRSLSDCSAQSMQQVRSCFRL